MTLEQKNTLEIIKSIVKGNKYLKRNHPLMYKDIQRRLDDKKQCALEGLTKKVDEGYKGMIKNVFKKVSKYAGIAALAAALVFLPAKYIAKRTFQPSEPVTVCTVKKGDNLWNLTKDYLKKNGIKPYDKTVYLAVDKVAEYNSKGKQAEYDVRSKDKKSPHHIKPGQKISFSKNILKHIKGSGKK